MTELKIKLTLSLPHPRLDLRVKGGTALICQKLLVIKLIMRMWSCIIKTSLKVPICISNLKQLHQCIWRGNSIRIRITKEGRKQLVWFLHSVASRSLTKFRVCTINRYQHLTSSRILTVFWSQAKTEWQVKTFGTRVNSSIEMMGIGETTTKLMTITRRRERVMAMRKSTIATSTADLMIRSTINSSQVHLETLEMPRVIPE